jgi:hypothetical protein
MDNYSWICVHAYVVFGWTKVPILVFVQRVVNGSFSNNLTKVIMNALLVNGGLSK